MEPFASMKVHTHVWGSCSRGTVVAAEWLPKRGSISRLEPVTVDWAFGGCASCAMSVLSCLFLFGVGVIASNGLGGGVVAMVQPIHPPTPSMAKKDDR